MTTILLRFCGSKTLLKSDLYDGRNLKDISQIYYLKISGKYRTTHIWKDYAGRGMVLRSYGHFFRSDDMCRYICGFSSIYSRFATKVEIQNETYSCYRSATKFLLRTLPYTANTTPS